MPLVCFRAPLFRAARQRWKNKDSGVEMSVRQSARSKVQKCSVVQYMQAGQARSCNLLLCSALCCRWIARCETQLGRIHPGRFESPDPMRSPPCLSSTTLAPPGVRLQVSFVYL